MAASDGRERVRYWLLQIESAKKREERYRKEGKRIRKVYGGEEGEKVPFNILFSNTETMLPVMYSQVPRPVVQRRYKDDDAVGKAAAVAGQRLLEFLLDTNVEGYETFHDAIRGAVMDALLPGRGVTAIRYEADTSGDVLQSELICPERISWDRVYFGFARKWSKVPWVAFERHLDRKTAREWFGPKAEKMAFTPGDSEDEKYEGYREGKEDAERGTVCVYQIWDKDGGRKIRYVSPAYPDGLLREDDDPLGLTGFFNIPEPLQFVAKTDDLCPTALYLLYENQANELNSLTVRITRLVKAIKARGIYDSSLGADIERLMDADENALVPSERGASLAAEKGLQNAVWFMPLEVLQQTLQQLYVAREQCKQVIYEIMGISDILRGTSKASETLGAQQIKNTWGSLRLKPKQAEVQRYCRDLLRMMLEVAAKRFDEDTWSRMTGLPYMTAMQYQQAQMLAQQAAMQGDMSMMEQLRGAVTWAQVLEVLRSDLQRAYKIDIETNSTVEPEAVEDQKNVTELMTAIGQFLNGVGPLVQQGVMPFEAAQSMLLAITRRFRFGTEIEDYVRNMKPPAPQGDGGESKLQKLELNAKQREMQMQAENQRLQDELNKLRSQYELEKRAAELDIREIGLKTAEEQFKLEQKAAQESIQIKSVVESTKLDAKKQITNLEAKRAQPAVEIAKQLDGKMSRSVEQLGQMITKMVESQTQLLAAVAAQAQQTQELAAAVRAPRRKRPTRDPKTGLIMEVTEELVQ